MVTAMTAAANIEIFLASLGIAALIALGALRVAFQLMTNAGIGAGRHYTVRKAPVTPALVFAQVRSTESQGHSKAC
jgi:hypothetical protein